MTRAGTLRVAGLLGAPLGAVALLFFAPLAAMMRESVAPAGDVPGLHGAAFTLEHYARFFGDAYYLSALFITLATGVLVVLIALAVSYPVAYLYWQSRGSVRSLLAVLLLSPFYANVVVKVFGWMVLLSPAGLVNGLLGRLGVLAEPIDLLGGYFAIVLVSVHRAMPFMVLLLAGAMAQIDDELLESARVCGASGLRVFRTVVLPLSVPGALAGSILVFSLTAAAFVVPVLVGGPAGGRFLPVLMYQQITVVQNWRFGAAIAMVLLATSVLAIALGSRGLKKLRVGRVIGEGFAG